MPNSRASNPSGRGGDPAPPPTPISPLPTFACAYMMPTQRMSRILTQPVDQRRDTTGGGAAGRRSTTFLLIYALANAGGVIGYLPLLTLLLAMRGPAWWALCQPSPSEMIAQNQLLVAPLLSSNRR